MALVRFLNGCDGVYEDFKCIIRYSPIGSLITNPTRSSRWL